jgi:hypothetical protein
MGREDAAEAQMPAWLTPRRGPIPRDVARIKENSPFRAWGVPLLSHPHRRPHTQRPAVRRLRQPEDSGAIARSASSSGTGTDDPRAFTARGASDEERTLFRRMSAVFKDGVLPELNDEWKQIMARQMGMPAHLLREPAPDPTTIDRAKRCALVPPAQVPASAATPRRSLERAFAPGTAPAEACRRVLDDVCSPQQRPGASRARRLADSAIRIARLSRPRHITRKSEKSTSPRAKLEGQPREQPAEPNQQEVAAAPAAAERIVDDEEPPFVWPDLLWYTPHRLDWQKNAGKPKPPSKHTGRREGDGEVKFNFFWNKLAQDEQYLFQLTANQAYRGRNKANNLSEEEMEEVKSRAAQIRYMWLRRQLKQEKFAAKEEKAQKELELKQRREEEERLRAEQLRVRRTRGGKLKGEGRA